MSECGLLTVENVLARGVGGSYWLGNLPKRQGHRHTGKRLDQVCQPSVYHEAWCWKGNQHTGICWDMLRPGLPTLCVSWSMMLKRSSGYRDMLRPSVCYTAWCWKAGAWPHYPVGLPCPECETSKLRVSNFHCHPSGVQELLHEFVHSTRDASQSQTSGLSCFFFVFCFFFGLQ